MKKLLIVIPLIIIIIFLVLINYTPNIKVSYDNSLTNKSVVVTTTKLDKALYSYNNSEYTNSNTFEVTSNMDLEIKIKIKNKVITKNISITNIDTTIPIVESAYIKDNVITINATDNNDIEYIYVIDGVSTISKDNTYTLPTYESLEIKIKDSAGNITLVDENYYNKKIGELKTIYDKSLTNKSIILTIIKDDTFDGYYIGTLETPTFSLNNTLEITKNGKYYVAVKSKDNIKKDIINITNIDTTKPTFTITKTYKDDNVIITIKATDNMSKTFSYNFDNNWVTTNSKTIKNVKGTYTIKVRDEALNISSKTFTLEGILPTLTINYDKTLTPNPVVITVTTESGNLISYNNGEWTTNKTITISKNVNNYSIRVKKNDDIIEKFINITNIREKTVKEKNAELINNIKTKYGFSVTYGTGTYCYYNYSSCTILTDETKAFDALTILYNKLTIFPTDFFRTFQGVNGYRMELFDDIPGDVAGLASYEIGDDNVILIDVNQTLIGRTFFHETWHIMEKYIEWKNSHEWDNWSSLNPSSFAYGNTSSNIYTSISYDYDTNTWATPINEVSFISTYAKTNEREDRAELFADLMFRPYKKDYMAAGFGINNKAKYLATVIRKYFKNSTNATWERWITW